MKKQYPHRFDESVRTVPIAKYLGIQTRSVAMGTGFLSEYSAEYADSLGMESYGMSNKLLVACATGTAVIVEKDYGSILHTGIKNDP